MKIIAKTRSGFSLVELLVVIAVVALLALITIPVIKEVRNRATQTKDASKIRTVGQAVLLYHNSTGQLPGRLNRAVRVPGAVVEGHRDRWFSTYMADKDFLPADDAFWEPVVDYGIRESGHGYILNNTVNSEPGNFFGRRSNTPSLVSAPLNLNQLRANLRGGDPEESQPLTEIWMMTNLDGENYNSTATAGSEFSIEGEVLTPWGGRNYVFFDGHVEFFERGNYPSHN